MPPALLAGWFAATLRDGFALTAAGGYADFAAIALPTLAALLEDGPELTTSASAAAEHVVGAMGKLPLHPDVAPGLRRLAQAGVRCVTLSNGAAAVAESLLERAGVRDLVEACLSVSDAGRWKPAAEAYAYAAERCAVPRDAAVLIAVHPWDIDGAQRAGLRTGWISRGGAAYPPYMRPPDEQASDLVALVERLGAAP